MTRIRVWFNGIRCKDAETVFGPDHFYLVGVITDGENTSAVITDPVHVKKGEYKGLKMRGSATVFDFDVPDDRAIKVALAAFDKDSKDDWEEYGEAVNSIAGAVSGVLKTIPNPYTVAAGVILPIAVGAVGKIMSLDKDDKLGELARDFPVIALQGGDNRQTWSFSGKVLWWWSDWNYSLDYSVVKG